MADNIQRVTCSADNPTGRCQIQQKILWERGGEGKPSKNAIATTNAAQKVSSNKNFETSLSKHSSLPPTINITILYPSNSTLPMLSSVHSDEKKSTNQLPPLTFIWEYPKIKWLPGPNGPLSEMQCVYCKKCYCSPNLYASLLFKVPDALAKCKGIFPPAYHQQYLQLYNSLKEK